VRESTSEPASEPVPEPVSERVPESGATGERSPAVDDSDAFISYSHLDREFAVRLRDALRDAGKRPWLDETEISGGTRWSEALERAIQRADAFVFVVSPYSVGSRECRRELDYALELNKRILPVRIAETSAEALPPRLAEYQFIPGRTLFDEDFAGSTRRLITEIETDREWVREHTDWSEKASEWSAHDRNRSYLLSGAELRSAERWRSRAAGKRPGVSTPQSEFIDASRQHATSRLRRTRAAVSVALAVALGLAALAVVLRQQAVSASHTARSRQLAAESLLQLSSDPQVALKLAIASADVKHTSDAMNALRAAIPQNHMLHRLSADGKPLIDARWSSDGSMVVTASQDNAVLVYDASSGRLLRKFPAPGLVSLEPGGAFFVDHDREVLAWGPGYVRTWSLATGERVLSLSDASFGAPLADVVVNRQGTMIATAAGPGAGGAVLLWSARTGRRLHVLIRESARIPNAEVPQQVAFSPNGQLLAGGTQLGTALIWNARTGGFVRQLNLSAARAYPLVERVAFSPDGTMLATGQSSFSESRGRTVLWNLSAPAATPPWVAGTDPVWSPDGAFVTTTVAGEQLVWKLASLQKVWAKSPDFDAPDRIPPTFGPGSGGFPGDLVIPSPNGFATVWDTYTGDVIERLAGDSGSVSTAGFSPDGSKILTWSSDGTARIWENGVINGTTAPHAAAAGATAAAAGVPDDGPAGVSLQQPADLETRVRAYITGDDDSPPDSLIVFDSRTGERLAAIRIGQGAPAASFDGAGNLMLVTNVNASSKAVYGAAEIRRTRGGALLRTLPGTITAGSLSPDGKLAATVSLDDEVAIWDVASGRRVSVFRGDQATPSTRYSGRLWVSFSPDSTLVLSSDPRGRAFVWRATSGHQIAEMKGDPEPPSGQYAGVSGAISRDDKLVVLGRGWDDDAYVYRLGSSTPQLTLLGNPAGIVQVAFSRSSQLIATLDATTHPQVNVYDTESQQPLFTIADTFAQAVGFSADSRSVLTDQRFPYEIYPCSVCGGFDQLLPAARQREVDGGLTAQERFLYLR
jgi:WD40 repeat protein